MKSNQTIQAKENNNQLLHLSDLQRHRLLLSLSIAATHYLSKGKKSPYPSTQQHVCTYALSVQLFTGINTYNLIEGKLNDISNPTGSTPATPAMGYNFYKAVYRIFRVYKNRIFVKVTNTESVTPINFYVILSDTQPSTFITSWDDCVVFSSSPLASKTLLVPGDQANSLVELPFIDIFTGDVLGNPLSYYSDIGYSGSDIAAPTQNLWWAFVSYAADGATSYADGLKVTAEILYSTEFYSVRPIA